MKAERGNRKQNDSRRGRALRWSATASVLAVTPKCLLCVFGYLALAAGARVEICGAGPSRGQAEVARCLAPILAIGAIGTAGGKAIFSVPQVPPFPR